MEPRVGAGAGGGEAGFTLIELMVVVAILSLLTLTAALGVGRPRAAETADWARFQALHQRLREQAVMGGAVLGLRLAPGGYARVRRTGDGWVADGPQTAWQGSVAVQQPAEPGQVIAFLPSGEARAVRIVFDGGVVCDGGAWERLRCE